MMMTQTIYLYPQNTQVLTLNGLQDVVTGDYLNQATVTATLIDRLGNVDVVINDLPLDYLPASNGNYQGTVPFAFDAALGGGYILQVTANQAGVQSFFSFPTIVQLRKQ